MACLVDKLITRNVVSLDEGATVQEAVEAMALTNLGSVTVTRNGRINGLFTERDLVHRVVSQGLDPKTTPLGAVCSRKLISITHTTGCWEAIHKMRAARCRRLLVYKGKEFLGLVKLHDVAHELAEGRSKQGFLVNAVGGLTLLVALAVIAMLIYQLPNMMSLAQRVNGS